MTRSSASPWYRGRSFSEAWSGDVLVALSPYYIRISLRDLEAYKTRALWVTEPDFTEAYDALCKQGAALLMDATDRLVMEIRALRDGPDTPPEAQDPATNPFTLDLFSLRSIAGRLSTDGKSNAFILEEIRTILEAQGEGEGGQLEALLQIVALLSV